MVKKNHTVKNTVITSLDFIILYIGCTFAGRNHDYGMLKKEFDPSLNWFSFVDVLIDLGYIGFCKDYTAKNVYIPHKKPYKTKNNPNPQLSNLQKDENKEISRKRIVVENCIGGMKRFRCLVDRFRNHIPFVKDLTILLAAGIWNLNVVNRK